MSLVVQNKSSLSSYLVDIFKKDKAFSERWNSSAPEAMDRVDKRKFLMSIETDFINVSRPS